MLLSQPEMLIGRFDAMTRSERIEALDAKLLMALRDGQVTDSGITLPEQFRFAHVVECPEELRVEEAVGLTRPGASSSRNVDVEGWRPLPVAEFAASIHISSSNQRWIGKTVFSGKVLRFEEVQPDEEPVYMLYSLGQSLRAHIPDPRLLHIRI